MKTTSILHCSVSEYLDFETGIHASYTINRARLEAKSCSGEYIQTRPALQEAESGLKLWGHGLATQEAHSVLKVALSPAAHQGNANVAVWPIRAFYKMHTVAGAAFQT